MSKSQIQAAPKVGDLRVWWIPQIPGKPFHFPVSTVEQGAMMMDALAKYDLFQLEHNIKPDYSNTGGLQVFVADDGDGGPGWVDWYDENTGIEDPDEWKHDLALASDSELLAEMCQAYDGLVKYVEAITADFVPPAMPGIDRDHFDKVRADAATVLSAGGHRDV